VLSEENSDLKVVWVVAVMLQLPSAVAAAEAVADGRELDFEFKFDTHPIRNADIRHPSVGIAVLTPVWSHGVL